MQRAGFVITLTLFGIDLNCSSSFPASLRRTRDTAAGGRGHRTLQQTGALIPTELLQNRASTFYAALGFMALASWIHPATSPIATTRRSQIRKISKLERVIIIKSKEKATWKDFAHMERTARTRSCPQWYLCLTTALLVDPKCPVDKNRRLLRSDCLDQCTTFLSPQYAAMVKKA